MKTHEFRDFEEFWPFYVREHSHPLNRSLHFVGTTLAVGLLAGGLLTRRKWMLLAAPVAGYGFAWAGHFLVQGNKPATFKHPLWSLRGDFKMWTMIATGKMDAEVERVMREDGVTAEEAAQPHPTAPDSSVN
jgi:hypothetical protein